MTPADWIKAVRKLGYRLHLTDVLQRPVLIDAPEKGFGDEWDDLAPAMRLIGIDAVADELRRERLS
jgi:hypothetical protein